MRKILYLIICLPLLLLSACDVHEWPETPEFVKMHLRLNYETDMTEWEHLYDGAEVIEQGYGETYDNHRDYGKIRYIVRTYPVSEKMRTTSDYTQEFVFTKDISEGYDHEVTLDLLPGNYNVMVWSDLVQTSSDSISTMPTTLRKSDCKATIRVTMTIVTLSEVQTTFPS